MIQRNITEMQQKFQQDTQNTTLFEYLSFYYRQQKCWKELDMVLVEYGQARTASNQKEASDLFTEAGYIASLYLQDKSKAAQHWHTALLLFPAQERAFLALENHYLHLQNDEELAQLYQRRLDAIGQKASLDLILKAAQCQERLERIPEAIALYQQAREIAPRHEGILQRLATLLQETSNWQKAMAVWQSLLAITTNERDRENLNLQLAKLCESQKDWAKAIGYYRRIRNPILEPHIVELLEQHADPLTLSVVWLEKAETSNEPPYQAQLYQKLASIQKQSVDAVQFYQKAQQCNPTDTTIMVKLAALFWQEKKWADWIACQLQISASMNQRERVVYLHRQAELLATQPDINASLENIYTEILHIDASDTPTIQNLAQLYRTIENYPALIQLLESSLEFGSLTFRIQMTYQLAKQYQQSNLISQATHYYQKVLAMQQDHASSLDQLQELYQKQGKFPELIQILEQKIELHPEHTATYYQEIGEIYRDRLQQIPQAISAFENALVHDEYALDSIEALRALFYSQQDWPQYFYYTEKKLEAVVDVQQAIALHIELAQLYNDQKNIAMSEQHWLQVLQYAPVHPQALQQLRQLYESSQRYNDAIAILEKLAMFSTSSQETPKIYLAIARLYRDQIKNLPAAWSYLVSAQRLLPCDHTVLLELQELAQQLGKMSDVIAILKQRLYLVAPHEMPPIQALLAKLCEQQDQDQEAIRYYAAALQNEPSLTWVEPLALLYQKHQQYQPLVELLLMTLKFDISNEQRKQTYLQLIELSHQLNNKPQIIEYYQKLLLLDTKPEWISELTRLCQEYGRWEDLAQIYEKQIAHITNSTEKYQILQKLADVYRQLGNIEKLKIILREMLVIQVDITILQELQERCLDTQDWPGLLEALERESTDATHQRQLELYQQMGEIYQNELPDIERAIGCYQKCLTLEPESPECYKILAKLYLLQRDYRQCFMMLDKEIQFTTESEHKAALYVEQARLHQIFLQQPQEAQRLFLLALEIAPTYQPAWQALQKFYYRQQRWNDLVALWEKKLAISSGTQAIEIQLEIAKLYETQLKNSTQAQQCLEQILKTGYHEEAARSLRRIYYIAKNWPALRDLYQQGLANITNNNTLVITLLLGLGKLYQEQLNDPAQAANLFLRIIKMKPTHLPAIKSLQQIYHQQKLPLALAEAYLAESIIPDVPATRRICLHLRCAEIFTAENKIDAAIQQYQQVLKCDASQLYAIRGLQDLYRQKGMVAELADLLLSELGIEKQEPRLFAVHYELSHLYQGPLANVAEAIAHLSKAYHYHPYDMNIQKELEVTLQQNNQWEQYAEYLESRLAKITSQHSDTKQKFHRELALLYDQHLHNDDKSIYHWEQALLLGDIPLEELHILQQLYQKPNQHPAPEKILLVYERELSKDVPLHRMIHVYQEIGLIAYERLQDLKKAALYFEKILAVEHNHKIAIDNLSQIYLKQERWQELVGLLIKSCYYLTDPKKKEATFCKIAAIFEKKLNNLDQAMSYYQKNILLGGKNLVSYQGVHRILESKKDWYGLLDVLYREISLASLAEQPPLYLKAAKIWENRIKDISQAINVYLQMLQIHFHIETAENVALMLKSVRDYDNLAILLKEIISQCPDAPKKAQHLCSLGQVYAESLQKTEEAIAAYQAAFKIVPDIVIITALEELYTRQQQWADLVKIKESKLSLTLNTVQLQNLHLELGELYQHRLYDERKAILHYERSLELDPQHPVILHHLQNLYLEWGYFDSFIALVEKELTWLEDNNRRNMLLQQTAQILENRLFNQQRAIQVWERLLQSDPANPQALEALARLYQQTQNFKHLARIYQLQIAQLEQRGKTQELVQFCLILGELYFEKLTEYADAEQAGLRALHAQPGDYAVLNFLEKVYTATSDYAKLKDILLQKLHATTSASASVPAASATSSTPVPAAFSTSSTPVPVASATSSTPVPAASATTIKTDILSLHRHLAEICLKMGQMADVEHHYQEAFLMKSDVNILKALQELYRQTNQPQKLLATDLALLEHTTTPSDKIRLYQEMAQLSSEQPTESIGYLEKILAIDPQHAESMAKLVTLLESQQLWDKAILALNAWANFESDTLMKSKILFKRALIYQKLQREDLTLVDLEAAFALHSEDIEILVPLADLYYRLENWEKAQSMYERLMYWSNPEQLQALFPLVEVYFRLGKIAEKLHKQDMAVLRYLKAIELNSNHRNTLQQLGQIYYSNRQWQEALLLYMKLVQHPELTMDAQTAIRLQLAVIKDNIGMSEGALEGYLQVLDKNPKDLAALEALGHIYAERKDYAKALEYLLPLLDFSKEATGQLPAVPLPDVRHDVALQIRTLQQLAKVYQASNQLSQAIAMNLKLLDFEPHNIDILRRLTDLSIMDGQWQQAEKFATLCYQLAVLPQQQAEISVLLGQIQWQGYHNQQAALEYYTKATQLVPAYLPAIRSIMTMYQSAQQWQQMANAYREFLPQIPDILREQKIPMLMDMGQVLMEKVKDDDAAIATYEQLLKIAPDHQGAHSSIAMLAAKNSKRYTQAINEYRYLLSQDTFCSSAYQALYQLYLKDNQFDRAYLCCQSLKALEQTTSEQNVFLASIPERTPTAWLDPWTLDRLIPESQRGTLYEIMAMMDPWLEKVYPPYLEEKYNIRRKETLPKDSALPVSELVYGTMRALGISDLTIYQIEGQKMALENTQPATLILGSTLMTRFPANQIRFMLGRLLFYAARNHVMANKLTAFEYQDYVARVVEAFAETGTTATTEHAIVSKKISANLPRKIRKQLEERLDVLTEIYQSDTTNFQKALEQAANHCGLLLSDSIGDACRAYLWQTRNEEFRIDRISQYPAIKDMFLFYNSDEHIRLRKEIGIAVMKWEKS